MNTQLAIIILFIATLVSCNIRKYCDRYNPEDIYNLGLKHYSQFNTEHDLVEAFRYIFLASICGSDDADLTLAKMYRYGHGVRKMPSEAYGIYKRQAEKGSPVALYHLGEMTQRGESVNPDEELANEYFNRAAIY